MSQNHVLKRNEVPIEQTWDTTTIFKDDEAFEASFKALEEALPGVNDYQGKLSESAETLKEALSLRNELLYQFGHIYVYAHLNSDVDTANSHYRGLELKS